MRVKGNVQIAPPNCERVPPKTPSVQQQSLQQPTDQEWVTVGKSGRILRKQDKVVIKKEKRKLPKTAAISVKGSSNAFSYADALKRVRSNISLKDFDIQLPKIQKGMNGATIIEVTGPDNVQKADRLAAEMQQILKGEAHITPQYP